MNLVMHARSLTFVTRLTFMVPWVAIRTVACSSLCFECRLISSHDLLITELTVGTQPEGLLAIIRCRTNTGTHNDVESYVNLVQCCCGESTQQLHPRYSRSPDAICFSFFVTVITKRGIWKWLSFHSFAVLAFESATREILILPISWVPTSNSFAYV